MKICTPLRIPCLALAQFIFLAVNAQAQNFNLTIHMVGPISGGVGIVPLGQVCNSGSFPGATGDCTFAVPGGTAVRLTANAPGPGGTPGVFSLGTNSTIGCATSTCSFTMNASSEVTATYDPSRPKLVMSFTLLGDGQGDIGSDGSRYQNFDPFQFFAQSTVYAPNSVVTLTAWPVTSSRFAAFSAGTNNAAACNGSVTPCSFVLNADSAISATYYKLLSVAVAPASSTIGVGGSVDLDLIGTYSDGVIVPVPNSQGLWTTQASLAGRRYDLAAAAHGGKLYAIGGAAEISCAPGMTPPCYGPSSLVEVYDPATDTWSPRVSMSLQREGLAAATIGDRIYAVGGNQPGPPPASAVAKLEIYDPIANAWSNGPDIAGGPRMWASAAVLNGLLYVIGGMDQTGALLTSVEVYDPVANSWTPRTPMSVARRFFGAGVVNGILYAVGGDTGSGNSNVVEAYDPVADSWTTKAPLPNGRSLHTVAVVDGVLYVIGGNNNGMLGTVFAYDPVANTWNSSRSSMPTRRGEHASAVIDSRVYAVGGLTSPGFPSQVTTKLESFIDVAWNSSAPAVAPTNQNGVTFGQSLGATTVRGRVGPISCMNNVPDTCAVVTVANIEPPPPPPPPPPVCPTSVTFSLLPGSLVRSEVMLTVTEASTGMTFGPFAVPIGEPQEVEPGKYHLVFSAAPGDKVTSAQRGLNVACGDNLTVQLKFHK